MPLIVFIIFVFIGWRLWEYCDDITNKLNNAQKIIATFQEQKDNLYKYQQQISFLRKQNTDLINQLKNTRYQLQALYDENKKLKQINLKIITENKELQNKVTFLKEKLNKYESSFRKLYD